MKVNLERCGNAQAFCDQCFGKFVRDGKSRPCFLTEEDDGKEMLTITIKDGETVTIYEVPPELQKVIYEPSKELKEFEVEGTKSV